MNKQALIDEVAKTGEISKANAGKAVDTLLAMITDELQRGGEVQLTGFGTFRVIERAARQGRNPATGEAMRVPARKAPVFKAGAKLREAVSA